MRKWLWRKHHVDTAEREQAAVQAQQAFLDSEEEVVAAAMQAGRAHIVAESLRELRKTNHFALRMKSGIQEDLRE